MMEEHSEPLADEAAFYFRSLPSKPRMLARTNTETPYRDMTRVLAPIADAAIVSLWSDDLRDALVDILQETKDLCWTGFLPLRVEARSADPWKMDNPESTDFLVVGVSPGSTAWRGALDVALRCKKLLQINGIVGMEVIVLEMDVVALGGGASDEANADKSPTTAEPAPAPAPAGRLELLDIFDTRFSDVKIEALNRAANVNQAVVPFLPLPGQSLQPLDPGDAGKELPAGSLGCFVRLQDEQGALSTTLYALTSRHVAMQGACDHHSAFNSEASAAKKDIAVVCGSTAVIENQQRLLCKIKQYGPYALVVAAKAACAKGEPSDEKLAELELLEKYLSTYLPEVQSALHSLGCRDDSSRGARRVGTVAYSAAHGADEDGFFMDWALIAVSPGSPNGTTSKHFYSSVLFDTTAELVADAIDRDGGERICAPGNKNVTEPIAINAPHPPMLLRGRNPKSFPRYVVKRGAASALTVGLLSPIEAVLRRPLPGREVVSWAWPVFCPVLGPGDRPRNESFSVAGDSGSVVMDLEGTAVGMLDAGFGKHEAKAKSGRLLGHEGHGPTAKLQLGLAGTKQPLEAQIDISLLTPIDRIFASIQDVTGKMPRIV